MEGIESIEQKSLNIKYSTPIKRDRECIFGHNECRSWWVVYKSKSCMTHCIYIGQMQRFFKKRMEEHNREAIKFANEKKSSDTFVAHFGRLLKQSGARTDQAGVRDILDLSIIFQGDPSVAVRRWERAVVSFARASEFSSSRSIAKM